MPNKYLDSVGLAEYTSLIKGELAPKASPAFTGTPTAPTPTAGDDSTKIATTEFVQDAIDAEETRADGAYLPFTGGSITGNLSVSGTITGDVTGTATNATNDGNGDEIATTYLPLSGGTITGPIDYNTSDNLLFHIDPTGTYADVGWSYDGRHGGLIALRNENYTNNPGGFEIFARNASNEKTLIGKADGTLKWGSDNVFTSAGGTLLGQLINNGSNNIPINIKTNGTNYRDIQIESSDGNHRIATIRASKTSAGRCEITIGASTTSNAAPTGITISRSTTDIYATAPTPGETDNSTKIATTAFVRTIVPAGVVLAYAKGAVPTGWLLCDGSAVSRTTYAALFSVIGTTYGSGNGSTTFNLPNLTDRFIQGNGTVGTKKDAGLPNITGGFSVCAGSTGWATMNNVNGAFQLVAKVNEHGNFNGVTSENNNAGVTFNASRSSAVYGKSTTVQPPALTMRYIIKY